MAETKLIGARTALWFVKMSAVDTVANLRAGVLALDDFQAELASNDILNLTPAIEVGYTLNATESDRISSTAVSDEGNAFSIGLGNFEANMTFFREADPVANTTSVYEKAYQLFKGGNVFGFWIKRIGKRWNEALAVGDVYSAFEVQSELNLTDQDDEKGGPIKLPVPFGAQDTMLINKTVIATVAP